MRGACAVHAQCMRSACAVHAQRMRSACAVHVECIRNTFAVHSQCIRSAFAVPPGGKGTPEARIEQIRCKWRWNRYVHNGHGGGYPGRCSRAPLRYTRTGVDNGEAHPRRSVHVYHRFFRLR